MTSFVIPYPPSVNGYWRSYKGRQILSARARAYRKAGLATINQQGIPPSMTGDLHVTLVLYPPDQRCRDIDNPIKPVLDLLTHALVYDDDSQIKRLHVHMKPAGHRLAGTAQITVTHITETTEHEA